MKAIFVVYAPAASVSMVKKEKEELNTDPVTDQQEQLQRHAARLNLIIHAAIITAISVITWLALKTSLNNQFTDWDDKGYLLNNDLVKDLSLQGLKNIFTIPVMGNYHPITMLIYAVEYSFVQLKPWLYHFDSLALHLVVTILVYWLAHLLSNNKLNAFTAALLFGIHPMHVESVAWIAGRKDVLCALFYFAACIFYLYFIRAAGYKKKVWYIAVIVMFTGALLSKPTAVTLPLTLLLLDYFEKRNWTKSRLYEKTPHFILALIFGAVSLNIQYSGGATHIHKESYGLLEKISLGSYALVTYLWKAIAPVNLHCFYPYPAKIAGTLPYVYYIFPMLVAAIIFAVWKYPRNKRTLIFGLLFFLTNIMLLLQFIPVGDAVVAERYAYVPYFGLFFIIGHYASVSLLPGRKRYLLAVPYLAYLGCLFFLSNERCKVWYNTCSLWTDEIKKEPVHAPLAYNNLGFYFFEKGMADTDTAQRKSDNAAAIHFLTKAILLKPDFANAYEGLGILYMWSQHFDSSVLCFKTLAQLTPSSNSYYDYGSALYAAGKKDSAIIAYTTSVSIDSANSAAYLNRGIIYKEQKHWDEAASDFEKVKKINPYTGMAYYEESFCDTQKGNNNLALQEVRTAISLGYTTVDTNYCKLLMNSVK